MTDGWFRTGDLATRAPDGYIRIVGRRATDLIKSGGFKIGAGEIEGALLEHPGGQGGRRHRRARSRPRRADRRLDRHAARRVAVAGRAGRPRRRPADPAQAPARGPLPRRAAAQRDGQGPEEEADGMKVTGEHSFTHSRDEVWKALLDPAALTATLPGARRLEPTGPDEYLITVDVGVGSVRGTYDGTFALSGQGRARGVHGDGERQRPPGVGDRGRADAPRRRRQRPRGHDLRGRRQRDRSARGRRASG